MRQLEPTHYGLQLRKVVDKNVEWCVPALYEYMQEQASGSADQEGLSSLIHAQPHVAQAGLELHVSENNLEILTLLLPYPVCLEYKCVLPHLVRVMSGDQPQGHMS